MTRLEFIEVQRRINRETLWLCPEVMREANSLPRLVAEWKEYVQDEVETQEPYITKVSASDYYAAHEWVMALAKDSLVSLLLGSEEEKKFLS